MSFYPILTLVPYFCSIFSILFENKKIFWFFWFFGLFKPKNQNKLFLPLFTPKNVIFGLFKPKIFKNFLHILKVEKIPKKSRVQALKSDKNLWSYEGKCNMHFFMVFGVILPILGNPLEIL